MRKILTTYLPASLLLAFLAMVLLTCGGGGGGGGSFSSDEEIQPAPPAPPAPSVTLTGLSINGPSTMSEYDVENYAATASWSDGSSSTVTPTWIVNYPQMAEISSDGFLYCLVELASDQTVTIRATYSYGGITQTDTMSVTITNVPTIPFTNEELSGKVFFQKYSDGSSFLYILNADFSLELFATPGPNHYTTGTWSNDSDGLFLDYSLVFFGPYTVERISDSSTEMEVAIHEEVWGNPHVFYATWEKTVPVDPAKLPGTYAGSDGYTWVFNADGTGTVASFTFTSSVDSEGVLKMAFNTGYTGSVYTRATSQSTDTEYTILRIAFTEHNTSTGAFFKYYGGIELTRQ
jgi:hypothetical protein